MTKLLEQAIAQAQRLPASDQDALARFIIEELDAEQRWDELFTKAPGKLAELADKAWAEHEAGRTEPLDPGKL